MGKSGREGKHLKILVDENLPGAPPPPLLCPRFSSNYTNTFLVASVVVPIFSSENDLCGVVFGFAKISSEMEKKSPRLDIFTKNFL